MVGEMNATVSTVTGLMAIAASLLAGCASTSGSSPPSPSQVQASTAPTSAQTPATVSPSVTSSPTPTPTPSSTPVATVPGLADGRYAARITALDSPRRRVTIDVVQLFLGKAAAAAAAHDHAAEVPPPNDVWIRNESHLLRTLPVRPTAPITVNVLSAEITHSAVKNLPVSLTRLGEFPDLDAGVFWLEVEHGVVTRINEQFLP